MFHGWQSPERAVGSLFVVIFTPMLKFLSSMFQRKEDFRVQTFIAQLRVEALNESILQRLAWADKVQHHSVVIGPGVQDPAAKLRPVVHCDRLGQAAKEGQPFQTIHYLLSTRGPAGLQQQAGGNGRLDLCFRSSCRPPQKRNCKWRGLL